MNPTLDARAKDGPIRNQIAGAVLQANSGDIGYCLTASAQGSLDAETETLVAVTHSLRGEGFDASEDGTGRGTPLVPVAFRIAGDGAAFEEGSIAAPLTTGTDSSASAVVFGIDGAAHCLRSGASKVDKPNSTTYIAAPLAVRRLTPTECECLMGFPDDFTRIPYRGKPADKCPDGPRYKALGNSWAVNCADWIGERIQEVEAA